MSTPTQNPHEFDTLHEQPVVVPDDISTLHALTDTPKAEVSPAIPAVTAAAPEPAPEPVRDRTFPVLLGIFFVILVGLVVTAIVLQLTGTSPAPEPMPAPQTQVTAVPVVADMSGGPDVAERAGIAYWMPGGPDVAERAGLEALALAAALDDGMAGGPDVAERAGIEYWMSGGPDVVERAMLAAE